jgi:hypothetical protein
MPSQRTKVLALHKSMRTIKPNTTVTSQLIAAVRVKQDLKPANIALISRIMAPPLLSGVGFQGEGVRGRADKRLASVDHFQNGRDDRIPIKPDPIISLGQPDDF